MIPDIYDPLEDILEEQFFIRSSVPLRYLASELMSEFGYASVQELQNALIRTFEVCCALNIPISLHFKQVYVYDNGEMRTDWLLSDMGNYLLLVNGSTRNPNVARAQLYLLSRTKGEL